MNKELNFGEIVEERKQPEHPVRALLVVPHNGRKLIAARDAFGSNSYLNNMQSMRQPYSYPNSWERISFEHLTTAESISVAAYEFSSRAKPAVFDPSLLQTGYVLRTNGGVWANPLDAQGRPIQDESVLKGMLKSCRKIGVKYGKHIYIGSRGFGFAEYGTFDLGEQSGKDFVNGGLARVLENTSEPVAENLRTISDKSNYKLGVYVWAFEPVESPILRVASLDSVRYFGGSWLVVVGGWFGGDVGFAFGGLKTGEASALKNQ